jgi:hypothetical protein
VIEQRFYGSVIKIVEAFARQKNNIEAVMGEGCLSEVLTNYAFDTVSLDCFTHVFFGNDEAQAGRLMMTGSSENKGLLTCCFDGGLVEHSFEVSSA